jgi:uncharacterized membrane protein
VRDEREDAVRARMDEGPAAGSAEPASPGEPASVGANAIPAAEEANEEAGIDEQMTSVHDQRAFAHAGPAAAASAPAAPDDRTYQDAPAPPPPPWVRHDPRQPQLSPGARPSPRGPFGARPPRPGGPGGPAASNVPWQAATSWGPTTLTLDANTTAGVSYLFWWLSGLLVYFNERHNRYVRFHAVQSILLTSALTVCGVVAYILWALFHDFGRLTHLLVLTAIGNGVAILAATAILIIWLGAMIAAWTGHYLRFPYIGAYAERYSAPPAQPPIPPAF